MAEVLRELCLVHSHVELQVSSSVIWPRTFEVPRLQGLWRRDVVCSKQVYRRQVESYYRSFCVFLQSFSLCDLLKSFSHDL
jgi:hypothetical protein